MESGNTKVGAWLLLVLCAAVSAFAGALLFCSNGPNERWFGAMVMIFSGLVGAIGPVLLVLK